MEYKYVLPVEVSYCCHLNPPTDTMRGSMLRTSRCVCVHLSPDFRLASPQNKQVKPSRDQPVLITPSLSPLALISMTCHHSSVLPAWPKARRGWAVSQSVRGFCSLQVSTAGCARSFSCGVRLVLCSLQPPLGSFCLCSLVTSVDDTISLSISCSYR